ncbi:hypothetical protein [Paraburkholderia sp.]|uniref:hypothetical protein n=1 Tax=Paraburkholderia sp. TaxID=1926495 RepID=UPI0039E4FA4A
MTVTAAKQQQQQTVGVVAGLIDFDRFEEIFQGGTAEPLLDMGEVGVALIRHPERGVVLVLNTASGKFGMITGLGPQ